MERVPKGQCCFQQKRTIKGNDRGRKLVSKKEKEGIKKMGKRVAAIVGRRQVVEGRAHRILLSCMHVCAR